MKKLLFIFFVILLPNLGFAKDYDESVKNPDFVISRKDWGADETLRFKKSYKSRGNSNIKVTPEEKAFREKYGDEMKVSKVVTEDPQTGESLYWPISYSQNVEALIVHHSATDLPIGREKEALSAIYYWHSVVRGWGDIGYNYIIDPQGNIYEGRAGGPFSVGGHASLYNTGSVGIMVLGNFDINVPTAPSLVSLRKLLISLSTMYEIDLEKKISFRDKQDVWPVIGHKEVSNTACPGTNFFNFLSFWRYNEDFKYDYVASASGNIADREFFQVPAGSDLGLDFLGVSDPKRVVVIQDGESTVKTYNSSFKLPENESLVVLSYSGLNERGKQKIIEVRPNSYGIDIIDKIPLNISISPGGKTRITLDVVNNFYKPIEWKGFSEVSSSKFSIFPSIIASGGDVNWFSNRNLSSGQKKPVVFEINAPSKSGIYESTLVYDIGDGNILGGNPLKFRIKVGEDALRSNSIFNISMDSIEREIITKKGIEIVNIDIPVTLKFTKSDFDKYIKKKKITLLGENIPRGIKAFASFNNGGIRIKYTIERSVPNGEYNFFSILDVQSGVFNIKSVKTKFKIQRSNSSNNQKLNSIKLSEPKVSMVLRGIDPTKFKIVNIPIGMKLEGFSRNYSWDRSKIYPDNEFRGNLVAHTLKDGSNILVNEIMLEDYLLGLGEASVSDHIEKMKAIAVASRSYAYFYSLPENRKFTGTREFIDKNGNILDIDGSDDPNEFQKYVGFGIEKRNEKWVSAVKSTKGEVLRFNKQVIKPPYFSSSDGKTRSAKEVWGWDLSVYPYLDSKDDPWCNGNSLNGHGVGMSGCGAQGQALTGKNYKEILNYYYPGVEIVRLY